MAAKAKVLSMPEREETLQPAFVAIAGDVYPRYTPGEYEVRCNKVVEYEDPGYHRMVLMLKCSILGTTSEVVAFVNMGKPGEVVKKFRIRSEFYRVWCLANGGPPKKRQTMSRRIFEGKNFKVMVGDAGPKCAEYSKITKVLDCTWREPS